MKKIHLSIPKPCHENWDTMTPNEKGKFCSSCQKTVVDFTNMSDRQVAEFFKKPPSSVCGRIYNDQLERDIMIPKKRIPWLKYFFQITWPAFVLFLKSCGVKENSVGKVHVESKVSNREDVVTLGIMLPEITPVDTEHVEEKIITKGNIIGDIAWIDTIENQKTDSVEMQADTAMIITDTAIAYKPMDTVVITTYPPTRCYVTMGAISVVRSMTENRSEPVNKESIALPEINLYPNPVHTGGRLNISFKSGDDLPEQIQVLSSSGQWISSIKATIEEHGSSASVQIPSNLTAGVYFLQIITTNKKVKIKKVIVER